MHLRKILCPVDFSDATAAAARWADSLAGHFEAEVTLLHVAPALDLEFAAAQPRPSQLLQIAEHRHRLVRQTIAQFPGGPPLARCTERMVLEGDPAMEIARASKDGYDLIVMPTRQSGLQTWLTIGSVTTHVLHAVECPVLASVRFDTLYQIRGGAVLCALDLGPQSRSVLQAAAGIARDLEAQLAIVHAAPAFGDALEDFLDANWRATLKTRLCQKTAALQREAGAEGPIIVEPGDPHRVVADAVQSQGAGLVVIGRGARDGLWGRLRAHAYAIIRHSPCPVLSV